MKRSKNINLARMRKSALPRFSLHPLAIGVAASLTACAPREEVLVATSVEDCIDRSHLNEQQCEAAYERALREAERTGPKFSSQRQCERDFLNCETTSTGQWMPLMAGFMVAKAMDRRDYYGDHHYNPVYRYDYWGDGSYGRLTTADGRMIGGYGRSSYKVKYSAMKPKPTVTRTVSRGGFGAVASAKSSWGGGRAGGWGG
jgi:uncharacterized protein YgiB involved in biofilm formation